MEVFHAATVCQFRSGAERRAWASQVASPALTLTPKRTRTSTRPYKLHVLGFAAFTVLSLRMPQPGHMIPRCKMLCVFIDMDCPWRVLE
jgi:hypothetical protein